MGHDFIILATTEFWEHYGYLGLFAGSLLSALFIPLGADLLYVSMLAMGFNPWICLFIATTGGWIGGLVIYGVGYAGNATRIRKLFHIKEEQLLKQKNKIEKYGDLMALLVWIPVIGDISNVALGFYKTKRTHTFILMFIGRMCRFLLWTLLFLIFSSRFIKFFDKL